MMLLPRFAEAHSSGRPAFGISLRFHDPALIEMIGAHWDWVWIDMQHCVIDLAHLAGMIRACDLTGVTSFVRLPSQDPALLGRVLDLDVGGVIVPLVESADEAQRLVQAAKFPPLGNRSMGGRRICDRQGLSHQEAANRNQWLICQIESPSALEAADAIVTIEGVDGLMLGPDDFSLRAQLEVGESKRQGLIEADARLENATRAAGVAQVRFADEESLHRHRGHFVMLSISTDHLFIREGSVAASERARSLTQ